MISSQTQKYILSRKEYVVHIAIHAYAYISSCLPSHLVVIHHQKLPKKRKKINVALSSTITLAIETNQPSCV